MASKLHSLSLIGMAMAVFLIASSASAVIVKSGATTVFDDDFENDTVGAEPGSPEVGTWANTTFYSHVQNAAIPGPAQGENYLSLLRPGGVTVIADYGAVTSGTLSASFSMFIPTGSADAVTEVSLTPNFDTNADLTHAPVWLEADGSTVHTYVAPGGDASIFDTGVPFVKGIWQTWTVDYTFVPGSDNDTFTVSVDDNTSAPINAGGYGNVADPANLRYLDFRTGAAGVFYLDAPVTTPEPASLGLFAVSGLMLLRRRRA